MAKGPGSLTPREREVFALLAAGKTNGEISRELGISFPTAKAHVSSILAKLGAASREEAADVWRARSREHSRSSLRMVLAPLSLVILAAGLAFAGVMGSRLLFLHSDEPNRPEEFRVSLDEIVAEVPRHFEAPGLGYSQFGTAYGIWLVLDRGGDVRAFYDRDPHTGCVVPWNSDYVAGDYFIDGVYLPAEAGAFKEPCGGWVYLRTGIRVFGASPRGLDEFPVTVQGGFVHVDLGRLQLGQCAASAALPECSQQGHPRIVTAFPSAIVPNFGLHSPARAAPSGD